MEAYKLDNVNIIINRKGSREFSMVSYPIRYGGFFRDKDPGLPFSIQSERRDQIHSGSRSGLAPSFGVAVTVSPQK